MITFNISSTPWNIEGKFSSSSNFIFILIFSPGHNKKDSRYIPPLQTLQILPSQNLTGKDENLMPELPPPPLINGFLIHWRRTSTSGLQMTPSQDIKQAALGIVHPILLCYDISNICQQSTLILWGEKGERKQGGVGDDEHGGFCTRKINIF